MESDEEAPQHKRHRVHSPSPSPSDDSLSTSSSSSELGTQAGCALLSLPVELFEKITSQLQPRAFRRLVTTCSLLYERFRLNLVVQTFGECRGSTKIFCFEDADEGELGWRPFTIVDAGVDSFGAEDESDWAWVGYHEHELDVYHKNAPTRDNLVLQVTDEEVWIDWDSAEDWIVSQACDELFKGWDDISHRMVKATPELVQERFPCPECRGRGEIVYGSRMVAKRWPRIKATEWTHDGPCPRCTCSIDLATDIHREWLAACGENPETSEEEASD